MEPVSIGLLVAYILIIAIAIERSYRVHSLKLKCAVSDKNTEDLAHERRVFIITTLRKRGLRVSGQGGTWCVSGIFNNGGEYANDFVVYDTLVLLDDGGFYFDLNIVDGMRLTSRASIPYAEISEEALTVLCARYVDMYNTWVKAFYKNNTSKRKVTATPVICKIKKRKSRTEDVAESPKAPAKKKTPKYKAEKVSTKPVKVKIKK